MRYFLGVTAIALACSLGLAQQAPPQATAPAPATAPLAGQAPAAAPTSQPAAAPAAKPRPAPKNNFLLQNVRLIDGRGGPARDHVSILIKNGKIAQIVSGSAITLNDPDVEKLDLKGKTVMPGLINGHGHLGLTRAGRFSTAAFTEDTISSQLFHYQQYGVTTMISLGLNKDLLYQLRARQEKGEYAGATILTADRGIGVPNGVPQLPVEADQIYRPTTPEEARKDVDEMASRAPNLIKVWVDDSLHKAPTPSPAVYAAAIDEAHKQKLRVAAHVYYLADAKRLIQDGVDILAHSIRDQEVDADTISLLKAKKIYYIPTLQLEESFYIYAENPAWLDTPFFAGSINLGLFRILASAEYKKQVLDDPATPIHRAALQTAMVNLKKLKEGGVLVAFGTDSGANPYRISGWAEHRELQLMVSAGMTPLEAIHSATDVNAKMLQIEEKTGTVVVTKQADLLVLNEDPTTEIANTEKIAMVFHNGVRVR